MCESSFHPPLPFHKHSAFVFMIHRLVSVPLTYQAPSPRQQNPNRHRQPYSKETNFQNAGSNYTLPRNTKSNKWMRVPFLGKLSFKSNRILNQHDLTSAFNPMNTSKNMFSQLRDPIPRV